MIKLLLVGCGKMGGALLQGIADAGLTSAIAVIEPSGAPVALKLLKGIAWENAPAKLDASFIPDAIILAVKPQIIADTLPSYRRYTKALFISIAAGTTLATLAQTLQNPLAAIIRTMPNLPASVGQGMTVAVANKNVSDTQRVLCDQLLGAVGSTAWIEEEALLDAVTAVSGSGPAYIFALCEAMAKAGKALGIPDKLAMQLARQTVIGSGALLAHATESAEDLRRAVTSPKGTTEAALSKLLARPGLDALMLDTMRAATARAKELAR